MGIQAQHLIFIITRETDGGTGHLQFIQVVEQAREPHTIICMTGCREWPAGQRQLTVIVLLTEELIQTAALLILALLK